MILWDRVLSTFRLLSCPNLEPCLARISETAAPRVKISSILTHGEEMEYMGNFGQWPSWYSNRASRPTGLLFQGVVLDLLSLALLWHLKLPYNDEWPLLRVTGPCSNRPAPDHCGQVVLSPSRTTPSRNHRSTTSMSIWMSHHKAEFRLGGVFPVVLHGDIVLVNTY